MKGHIAFMSTWGLLVAASACESLPELPADVCGNGVIEAGEDCDGAAVEDFACDETCRVPCSESLDCPAGWGCGADDLCRQPSGRLAPLGTPSGLTADILIPGDFNGDRRTDLLAIEGLRVSSVFFDESGVLPNGGALAVQAVEDAPNLPAVADLDDDGLSDVILRSRGGLSVLRGQPDRRFSSLQFSRTSESFVGAALVEGEYLLRTFVDQRQAAGNTQLLAVRRDGVYLVRDRHPSLEGQLPLKLFSWPATDAIPFVLNVGDGNAAETLYIAAPGATDVTVHRMTYFDSTASQVVFNVPPHTAPEAPAPVAVSLPAGATVSGPAHPVATLSGRQWDLLIRGKEAGDDPEGPGRVYIAFELSGGGYGSFVDPMAPAPADFTAAPVQYDFVEGPGPAEGTQPLLVAGFDDRDGPDMDIVFPDGAYRTSCGSGTCAIPAVAGEPLRVTYQPWLRPLSEPWTTAQVVGETPFSANVRSANALVLSNGGSGFTFVREQGDLPIANFVPTNGPVRQFLLTDLDEDNLNDFVITQGRTLPDGTEAQDLFIAFGRLGNLPELPFVEIGDVGQARGMITQRLDDGETPDGLRDLVVYGPRDGQLELSIFEGSTDRILQSPLDLPGACAGVGLRPGSERIVAAGRFGSDGRLEVAVGFERDGGQIELLSVALEGRVAEALCTELATSVSLAVPADASFRTATTDLDGDGVDELVILTVGGEPQPLRVARKGPEGWTVTDVALDVAYRGMAIVELGLDSGPGVAIWSQDQVTILRNDGSGSLDPVRSTGIDLSGVTCDDVAVGTVNGVATLRLDVDARREMTVVTDVASLVVAFDESGKAGSPQCLGAAIGGGTAVAAGDVNGDGLDDLVVSRADGTAVLAGVPVTP